MNRFDLTFDTLFKIGILLLGVVLLFEFHSFNQKGRYQYLSEGGVGVLDTATGIVYVRRLHATDGLPGSVVFPENKVDLTGLP